MSQQTNDNMLSAIFSNKQGDETQHQHNNFASDIRGEIVDDDDDRNKRGSGGFVHDFTEVPDISNNPNGL